jgi:hypothetical protein
MPRHRIERTPRHRAQRPAQGRTRRVQLGAVATRSPSHAKPAAGPGPSDRLAALNARFWPYQRRLLIGAARGLVVSPWFAAGAGFVIAAGAFIYAPHTRLEIGAPPCKLVVCRTIIQAGEPPIPAGAPGGLVTPSPATGAATANDGLSFTYTVNWQAHDAFQLALTVRAKKPIGSWRLEFVIPGAANLSVSGASWHPTGDDGGTASGTAGDSSSDGAGAQNSSSHGEQPSGSYGNPGDPASNAGQGDQPGVVSFTVNGSGTPASPASCSFNGNPCQFSEG